MIDSYAGLFKFRQIQIRSTQPKQTNHLNYQASRRRQRSNLSALGLKQDFLRDIEEYRVKQRNERFFQCLFW